MLDQFNRRIDYARISLTESCSQACVYCRNPHEPAKKSVPPLEEVHAAAFALANLGVSTIRLTGGEPSLYPRLEELIASIKSIPGMDTVLMTTNGQNLASKIGDLKKAGLDGITFSLDSLDPERYRAITRAGSLEDVLESVRIALECGLEVKVNCVPFKMNKEDFVQVASLAQKFPIQVRFIEMMPIGLGRYMEPLKAKEILDALEKAWGPLKPKNIRLGKGPAVYYEVQGWKGHIGMIAAISHEFCSQCSRIRLSSDMKVFPCLNSPHGVDIRPYLQDPEKLETVLMDLLYHKPRRHEFEKLNLERQMNQIGG